MTESTIASAYVPASEMVLNPDLLEKSALERLPQPTGRYAGARFKLEDGEEVRIINDDEVIGTILHPADIVSFK